MKAWRRTSSSRSSSPALPVAVVTSVVTDGSPTAVWNFSKNVDDIADASALVIGGDATGSVSGGLGSNSIEVTYAGGPTPGQAYTLNAAAADITFNPPATIANQSGFAT